MTTTALVFPGQGPQEPAMLLDRQHDPHFVRLYPAVVAATGRDLLGELASRGPEILRENAVASAVTVLTSAVELARLADRLGPDGAAGAVAVAGYSVGQWSAMVAAGMLSFEDALAVVVRRAALMDDSEAVRDGAMLAVIGLGTDAVEGVCAELRASGLQVEISNYNCLGQLTLAGTRAAIAEAEARLTALKPRKLAPVPVAGAWHSVLLAGAAERFRAHLDGVALAAPRVPVADNVSGGLLPTDPALLRDALAAHVRSPVRWEACVRTLIAETGATTFAEVGHGDMLSKFGFFIDRGRRHVPVARLG